MESKSILWALRLMSTFGEKKSLSMNKVLFVHKLMNLRNNRGKLMKSGEIMDANQTFTPGEIVYIIIRNPHAQDVANIQQAAVVQNPDKPNELALFIHETYFPLTDELAVFKSEMEAEQLFHEAFSPSEDGDYYG